MALRNVSYKVSPTQVNLSGFSKMNTAMGSVSKTATGVNRSVLRSFGSIGKSVSRFAVRTTAVFTAAGAAGVVFSTKLAAGAEEVENKYAVVFAGMTDTTDAWINQYAKDVGRSRFETKRLLSDSQDLLTGFGATSTEAFGLSKQIQTLGVDLASFNNLQDTDAIESLRKGLLGETENLKKLGIIVNETMLKEEARKQGITESWAEISQLEKVQLRYTIAVRQSKNAIGDAERSQGSLTNQTKALKSNITDLATTFGQMFIPLATEVVTTLNDKLAPAFDFVQTEFKDSVIGMGRSAGGLASSIKDVVRDILREFNINPNDINLGNVITTSLDGISSAFDGVSGFITDNKQLFTDFGITAGNVLKVFGEDLDELPIDEAAQALGSLVEIINIFGTDSDNVLFKFAGWLKDAIVPDLTVVLDLVNLILDSMKNIANLDFDSFLSKNVKGVNPFGNIKPAFDFISEVFVKKPEAPFVTPEQVKSDKQTTEIFENVFNQGAIPGFSSEGTSLPAGSTLTPPNQGGGGGTQHIIFDMNINGSADPVLKESISKETKNVLNEVFRGLTVEITGG